MVVQRAARDPGPLDDLFRRNARVAAFGEQLTGYRQQRCARRFGLLCLSRAALHYYAADSKSTSTRSVVRATSRMAPTASSTATRYLTHIQSVCNIHTVCMSTW